jgi:hypothetical protein
VLTSEATEKWHQCERELCEILPDTNDLLREEAEEKIIYRGSIEEEGKL